MYSTGKLSSWLGAVGMLQASTRSQAAAGSSHPSSYISRRAPRRSPPPKQQLFLWGGGTTHEDSGVRIAFLKFQVREQYAHGFVPFDSESQSEFGVSSPKLKTK